MDIPITWPITRERYRQVLLKMRRQSDKIENLESTRRNFIDQLETEIKCLKKHIKLKDMNNGYTYPDQVKLNTIKEILNFYKTIDC